MSTQISDSQMDLLPRMRELGSHSRHCLLSLLERYVHERRAKAKVLEELPQAIVQACTGFVASCDKRQGRYVECLCLFPSRDNAPVWDVAVFRFDVKRRGFAADLVGVLNNETVNTFMLRGFGQAAQDALTKKNIGMASKALVHNLLRACEADQNMGAGRGSIEVPLKSQCGIFYAKKMDTEAGRKWGIESFRPADDFGPGALEAYVRETIDGRAGE